MDEMLYDMLSVQTELLNVCGWEDLDNEKPFELRKNDRLENKKQILTLITPHQKEWLRAISLHCVQVHRVQEINIYRSVFYYLPT